MKWFVYIFGAVICVSCMDSTHSSRTTLPAVTEAAMMALPSTKKDYAVSVIRVHDGDTFMANLNEPFCLPYSDTDAGPWGIFCYHIQIRVRGIDTPEMNDPRPDIRVLARSAQMELDKLVSCDNVTLSHLSRDKYFRILADVNACGTDVAAAMLESKLAKPYSGKGEKPWES